MSTYSFDDFVSNCKSLVDKTIPEVFSLRKPVCVVRLDSDIQKIVCSCDYGMSLWVKIDDFQPKDARIDFSRERICEVLYELAEKGPGGAMKFEGVWYKFIEH
jgi:hypothetical protein